MGLGIRGIMTSGCVCIAAMMAFWTNFTQLSYYLQYKDAFSGLFDLE